MEAEFLLTTSYFNIIQLFLSHLFYSNGLSLVLEVRINRLGLPISYDLLAIRHHQLTIDKYSIFHILLHEQVSTVHQGWFQLLFSITITLTFLTKKKITITFFTARPITITITFLLEGQLQ